MGPSETHDTVTAMEELVRRLFANAESIGPELPEAAIVRFESQAGLVLPSEYRTFLKHLNGCYATPLHYSCQPCGFPENVELHMILGIDRQPYIDLLATYLACKEWEPGVAKRPLELLPIAVDALNDEVCIIANPGRSDFGHVVFYDTLESEYGHEWEYVYPIADSMSLFLQGLFPSPP